MRRRKWGTLLVGIALGLAVLAGCGGDNDATEETATAAAKPQYVVPPVLEDIAQQLRAAGISADPTVLHDGEAEIEVQGAEIVYYTDPNEAAKESEGLLRVATGRPQKAMADAYGQVIVWTANEQPLTGAQRARFEEISAIVDPQR